MREDFFVNADAYKCIVDTATDDDIKELKKKYKKFKVLYLTDITDIKPLRFKRVKKEADQMSLLGAKEETEIVEVSCIDYFDARNILDRAILYGITSSGADELGTIVIGKEFDSKGKLKNINYDLGIKELDRLREFAI